MKRTTRLSLRVVFEKHGVFFGTSRLVRQLSVSVMVDFFKNDTSNLLCRGSFEVADVYPGASSDESGKAPNLIRILISWREHPYVEKRGGRCAKPKAGSAIAESALFLQ